MRSSLSVVLRAAPVVSSSFMRMAADGKYARTEDSAGSKLNSKTSRCQGGILMCPTRRIDGSVVTER